VIVVVDVIGDVVVIDAVIVAALVNGNDTVDVADTVDDQATLSARIASHLDVMKIDGLVDEERYVRGIELLERVVAMLTRLVDP
jgi:hypothetical protein